MPRRAARCLMVAALGANLGCSFVGVRPAPAVPPPPEVPLECTQSRTAPVLDTVGAVASPILGFSTWGLCLYLQAMQSWSSSPQKLSCGTVLWGTAIFTGAYAGSAVYGYRATGRCQRMVQERVVRPEGQGPLAGPGDRR